MWSEVVILSQQGTIGRLVITTALAEPEEHMMDGQGILADSNQRIRLVGHPLQHTLATCLESYLRVARTTILRLHSQWYHRLWKRS